MKKSILLLLTVALIMSLVLPVSAAGATGFLHSYYEVTEDTLVCYGTPLPAFGNLTVSMGQQKNVDAVFSTIAQDNVPTTLFCLVDTSAGMDADQMSQEISALMAISECMGPKDNMVIVTLGEQMYIGDPLGDRVARDQVIQSLTRSGTYTNLFQSVVQCLDILSTNSTYHKNRCLLILSDGIEDHRTSVTESQVIETIRNTTIPVYSIGVVQKYPSWYSLEHARQIVRFSDESVGGISCIPNNEDINAKAVGENIWKNIQESAVIHIKLPNVQWNTDSVQVLVRYETEESKLEGTISVYSLDLPDVYEETEPETEPETTVPETEPETTAPETTAETVPAVTEAAKEKSSGVIIFVAAAVVLLGAGAFLFLRRNRKEKEAAVQQPKPAAKPASNPSSFSATKPLVQTTPIAVPDKNNAQTGFGGKWCHVNFAAVSNRALRLDFPLPLNQPLTLGRDDRADIILNEKDPNLSGVHLEIMWDGKELMVRDKNSTNGTSVNGISKKANEWISLKNSDIIHAGNLEYRITFQQ